MSSVTNRSEFRKALLSWYHAQGRALPWRTLWHKHRNPWHVWVSEIMLQQTVIKAVIPVYERFLRQYPRPADLAAAATEDVRLAVRGLGYYRRFDLLHRAAKHLVEEFQGDWPKSYDEWKSLPGIGDYTASAISSITTNEPHGVVDGNVERVMCRLQNIQSAPNLPELKAKFKIQMNELVAKGFAGDLNQAVMELGQILCTPTSPKCQECPVAKFCQAFTTDTQHLAPGPKERAALKDIHVKLIIGKYGDRFALARRPASAKFLKETMGFPTLIAETKKRWRGDGYTPTNWVSDASKTQATVSIKHNITSHRITGSVVLFALHEAPADTELIHAKDLEARLVSNLDRKAWTAIQKSPALSH